jgi:hypothetical protein
MVDDISTARVPTSARRAIFLSVRACGTLGWSCEGGSGSREGLATLSDSAADFCELRITASPMAAPARRHRDGRRLSGSYEISPIDPRIVA